MNNLLKKDERLDDLELDNLMIIQKKEGYKFSTDSVLLSNFAKAKQNDVLVDLCSGSGVVAVLASHKNKVKECYAVEIQSEMADMARRTCEYNGLSIKVLNQDLKDVVKTLGAESTNVVTVNPPYNTDSKASEFPEIAMATHEIATNLSEVVSVSAKLLKFGGKLFMVHRCDRLVDILCECRKNGLEPKLIRIVYPKKNKEPNLVLIEAKKGAKAGIKVMSPLILMNNDGTETEELKQIYNRK